jgi:hypothetical protein
MKALGPCLCREGGESVRFMPLKRGGIKAFGPCHGREGE